MDFINQMFGSNKIYGSNNIQNSFSKLSEKLNSLSIDNSYSYDSLDFVTLSKMSVEKQTLYDQIEETANNLYLIEMQDLSLDKFSQVESDINQLYQNLQNLSNYNDSQELQHYGTVINEAILEVQALQEDGLPENIDQAALITTSDTSAIDLQGLADDLDDILTTTSIDSTGALTAGTENTLNGALGGLEENTQVVGLKGEEGGYIVIGQTENADGDGSGIVGQLFDETGQMVGAEFVINTTTSGDQLNPDVTSLEDGGFVVTYTDTTSNNLFAQHFDASGTKVGSEIQLNTTSLGEPVNAKITGLEDGGFVAIWQPDGSEGTIIGQRFDANGDALGGEFAASGTISFNDDQDPDIISLSGGGFAVSYYNDHIQNGTVGTKVQMFDSGGNEVGAEIFIANKQTDAVELTALNDGSFIATYEDGNNDALLQQYDSNGNTVGAEITLGGGVITNTDNPTITSFADDGYIVAYEGRQGSDRVIAFERYDSDGNQIGNVEIVNSDTSGTHTDPSVSATSSGFVVSWQSGSDTVVKEYTIEDYNQVGDPLHTSIMTQINTTITVLEQVDAAADPQLAAQEAYNRLGNLLDDLDRVTVDEEDVTQLENIAASVQAEQDTIAGYVATDLPTRSEQLSTLRGVADDLRGVMIGMRKSAAIPESATYTYTRPETIMPRADLVEVNHDEMEETQEMGRQFLTAINTSDMGIKCLVDEQGDIHLDTNSMALFESMLNTNTSPVVQLPTEESFETAINTILQSYQMQTEALAAIQAQQAQQRESLRENRRIVDLFRVEKSDTD